MVQLKINNKIITAPEESTILNTAMDNGIEIPNLCYHRDYPFYTSCMICMVQDMKTGNLIPSCSLPVREGMEIETENDTISEFRSTTLTLLLSEHIGDCEGPCQRFCPAQMDIPKMIRYIQKQNFQKALEIVKEHIALPAILGRICPAPCEKGCRRSKQDSAVSVCLLKRIVADRDLQSGKPFIPQKKVASQKKIALIGTGPMGLSAAYYLLQMGHGCTLFDKNPDSGGMLRYGIDKSILPDEIITSEVDVIKQMGAEFRYNCTIGVDISYTDIISEYDCTVFGLGSMKPEELPMLPMKHSDKGIVVDKKTFQTSIPGVFAGGNCVSVGKLAVRSCAHGRTIAFSIDQCLSNKKIIGQPLAFNAQIGKLLDNEINVFMAHASQKKRIEPQQTLSLGYTDKEAIEESHRCLHCDCRKPLSCKLRHYANTYSVSPKKYPISKRRSVIFTDNHPSVIHESGKCIKCGICVRITEKYKEEYGFTLLGRGYDIQSSIPFDEPLENGLQKAANECVKACPTGALSFKHVQED